VHDAVGVCIVERTKELEDVEADVQVGECGVEGFEVLVVHVLLDETGGVCVWLSHNVVQLYDVRAVGEVLQDLDFTADFLFFHRLEDLLMCV